MSKINSILIFVIVFVLLSATNTMAVDIRTYIETGGMGLTEKDISEGHKSYHLLGVSAAIENARTKITGGVEGFLRGEAEDEDTELLKWGAGAYADYLFKATERIHPYLGVRYDHWVRGFNRKYDSAIQEDTFDFFSAYAGCKFLYKWVWIDLGTNIPFYSNTQSGNFGIDNGIGFTYKRFDIGYRYKSVVFTDHHFRPGDDDLVFTFSGVEVGWTF